MDIYNQRIDALSQHDSTPEQRRVSEFMEAVRLGRERLDRDIDRMSAPVPLPKPPVSSDFYTMAQPSPTESHQPASNLIEAAREAAVAAYSNQLPESPILEDAA